MLVSLLKASSFLFPLSEVLRNFLLYCSGEYKGGRCLPFCGRVVSGYAVDVLSPSTELAGELATDDVLCSLLRELLMEACCCIPDKSSLDVVGRELSWSFLRRSCCFDSSLADLRRAGVLAPAGLPSSPQSDLDTSKG